MELQVKHISDVHQKLTLCAEGTVSLSSDSSEENKMDTLYIWEKGEQIGFIEHDNFTESHDFDRA